MTKLKHPLDMTLDQIKESWSQAYGFERQLMDTWIFPPAEYFIGTTGYYTFMQFVQMCDEINLQMISAEAAQRLCMHFRSRGLG